jgi:zinc finger protein 830
VRNIPKDQEVEPEPEVQESEAERRARVAREEKEEIMDRLDDEERAQ